jgi:replicative DNA helicase
MSDSNGNRVQWALMYAEKGFSIFPVHPDGKAPIGKLVPEGVKNATTDPTQIRDWWSAIPSANIGLATGRVFVIDLDVKDEVSGFDTWEEIKRDHDAPIPETTRVSTPSGGMHIFLRAPKGVKIKNSVSDALGDGVDVRGHGGYVIVPPSSIEGTRYQFLTEGKDFGDAPAWLVEKVRRKDREETAQRDVKKAPDTITRGSRNDKLTSLAGYLRHKGMTEDELENMLLVLNQTRCKPPLPEDEVRKIASSVGRYDPTDAHIRTTNEDAGEPPPEHREMARRLVSTLYHIPNHGPVIIPEVPNPESLPGIYGAVYSEMKEHGIVEGKLDRARLDSQFEGVQEYEKIREPTGFDPMRHEKDPTQLVEWAEQLTWQHANREMARDLKTLARDVSESQSPPGENVTAVVERIRDKATVGRRTLVTFQEAAEQARQRLADWRAGKASEYLRTWPSVDDVIDGFARGQMSVMAGFTSGFKTASLVDLMKRVAMRRGEFVIPIFSAEMEAEKLFRRCASNLSGVSQSRLRPDRHGRSDASEEEFQLYERAIEELAPLDIRIDEHPNPSYERMLSFCLQLQAEKPIAFVGFDYLEKMDVTEATEELRVSRIAQNCKALAKRLFEPVVVLSQYSRQENAHKYRPKNYYLRYSGKIEQEAETILHWFSPRYFEQRGEDPSDIWRFDGAIPDKIVAAMGKQREGQVGDAQLRVNPTCGRFIDPMDEREDEEGPFEPDQFHPDDNLPF